MSATENSADMGRNYNEKVDTWPKILRHNYEKYGDRRRAMRYKHYGIWQPYTWKDYYLNVKYLALGLLSLGFQPGDKLIIVGDNAPQWYCAELAAQANRGVSVGMYSDLSPAEIKYIADHSESRFAIVQDQEQVDKLLQIRDELPLLQKIIYWSYKGLAHYRDPVLTGYREILKAGEKYEGEHPGLFEQNIDAGRADDVCALVYTSGTTGAVPKGAIHTYGTMKTGADSYLRLDPWTEDDNFVPHLPPAWMTEQWFGIGCHLLSGSTLNFAEAPETQQRDTRETEPSIVIYGARMWESQAAAVQARILGTEALKRLAFRLLMPLGYGLADLKYRKKKPGPVRRIVYSLADIALFRPIRASLGLSNARICYSTGAALSPEASRFYHALNVPLKSLYGTTEGGALTGASNHEILVDTVGPALTGTEVKVSPGGEILYRRSGAFVGYHKDPGETARVLEDGWFHSGDSGVIHEDGHITFIDRCKDLVDLPGGVRLAPQQIECRLRSSPYIKDAWVCAVPAGARVSAPAGACVSAPAGACVSAIIVINYDTVSKWAGQRGVAYTSFAELSQRPEVYELVKTDIERVNRALAPGARVRRYVNLHKEFDPEEGELTRTRKLRRGVLQERYRTLIDSICGGKTEVPIEARIRHRDGRAGVLKTTLRIQSVEEGPS